MDKNLKSKTTTTKQFAIYDADIRVTLKQGQGHQTWYELENPNQGYDNTKFEKPCLNSVREKANDGVSVRSGNMSIICLEYVRKSKIVVDLLDVLNNRTKFQLNRIRT